MIKGMIELPNCRLSNIHVYKKFAFNVISLWIAVKDQKRFFTLDNASPNLVCLKFHWGGQWQKSCFFQIFSFKFHWGGQWQKISLRRAVTKTCRVFSKSLQIAFSPAAFYLLSGKWTAIGMQPRLKGFHNQPLWARQRCLHKVHLCVFHCRKKREILCYFIKKF